MAQRPHRTASSPQRLTADEPAHKVLSAAIAGLGPDAQRDLLATADRLALRPGRGGQAAQRLKDELVEILDEVLDDRSSLSEISASLPYDALGAEIDRVQAQHGLRVQVDRLLGRLPTPPAGAHDREQLLSELGLG